jgi:D-3-phosphoglycerate dehydrogenase
MISGKMFDHFKPGAILINCARGGVVNEDDLYEALVAGKLKAAACDAFVEEPPKKENKLLSLSNFSATPHIGGNTDDAIRRTGLQLVENVVHVIKGEPAVGIVKT